jgi:predicted nuclease of predicted toxin-antitoxin system
VNFLADHCLSFRTVRFLRQLGHDVVTVKQLGQQKSPDPDLLKLAESLDRVFITEDRDFGDILLYPPANYQGIIVVSTRTRERVVLHATLQKYLATKTRDDLRHLMVLIEENIVRIRR